LPPLFLAAVFCQWLFFLIANPNIYAKLEYLKETKMAKKNKLWSLAMVLAVRPAYAAIDCQVPPDCASLGYSLANVPNCETDGYIYCPFDRSYKKCVSKRPPECPADAVDCYTITCKSGYHYTKANGKCSAKVYNCEDAGYFSERLTAVASSCSDAITLTNYAGDDITCYRDCYFNETRTCESLNYSVAGACSSEGEVELPMKVEISSGDILDCGLCIDGSGYDLSSLALPKTITVAGLSDEQFYEKYVRNLDDAAEDDCAAYV